VTDDRTEAWWWKDHGNTIGPRQELVAEMHYRAGVCFYMHPLNRFSEHARQFLQQHVGSRLTKSLPSTFTPCWTKKLPRWSWRWCRGGRFRVLLGLLKSNKRYALVGKRTFREA
jgi:hypothetical protein